MSKSYASSALKVLAVKDEFLWAIEVHKVVIIVAEPGSGKSTQLPQFLLDAGWADSISRIAVTAPRRAAAVSLAQRIAEERRQTVGDEVAYMIRFEATTSDSTRLVCTTEGRLLMEALGDPLFSRYSVIVLDDCHERSLQLDMLLGLLKRVLRIRPSLRLVVCSATLDTDDFAEYFRPDAIRDVALKRQRWDAPAAGVAGVSGVHRPGTPLRDITEDKDSGSPPIPQFVSASATHRAEFVFSDVEEGGKDKQKKKKKKKKKKSRRHRSSSSSSSSLSSNEAVKMMEQLHKEQLEAAKKREEERRAEEKEAKRTERLKQEEEDARRRSYYKADGRSSPRSAGRYRQGYRRESPSRRVSPPRRGRQRRDTRSRSVSPRAGMRAWSPPADTGSSPPPQRERTNDYRPRNPRFEADRREAGSSRQRREETRKDTKWGPSPADTGTDKLVPGEAARPSVPGGWDRHPEGDAADKLEDAPPSPSDHPRSASDLKPVYVLRVEDTQPYPLAIAYCDKPPSDYLQGVVDTVIEIHRSEGSGDILVFLTGKEEIAFVVNAIKDRVDELRRIRGPRLFAVPLHAQLPMQKQIEVIRDIKIPGVRRAIISTNIAESSVTVEGVRFVVDSGFIKQNAAHPRWGRGLSVLSVVPASRSSARQRAGRAARQGPGKTFRLYSEEYLPALPVRPLPEIVRSDLSELTLFLMEMGLKSLVSIDFLSPPPVSAVETAMEKLYALEILDAEGQLTVPLGQRAATFCSGFGLHVETARFIAVSERFGCSSEAMVIAAMNSVDDPWSPPAGDRGSSKGGRIKKFELARRRLGVGEGDWISQLNVMAQWHFYRDQDPDFLRDHFLRPLIVDQAERVLQRMVRQAEALEIEPSSCGEDVQAVQRAAAATLFLNAAQHVGAGRYNLIRSPPPVSLNKEADVMDETPHVRLHPQSILYGRDPPWIVFEEAVATQSAVSKLSVELQSVEELEAAIDAHGEKLIYLMRGVTAIDGEWLLELAPHYFKKVDRKIG